MALIGGLYAGSAVIPNAGAGRWIVIVSIYLFCIVQATTWSISIKVWAPEIQPQHTRAQAISLAYGSSYTYSSKALGDKYVLVSFADWFNKQASIGSAISSSPSSVPFYSLRVLQVPISSSAAAPP